MSNSRLDDLLNLSTVPRWSTVPTTPSRRCLRSSMR